MPTHADRLRSDPRVAQAQRLLAEALREHAAALTSVKGPDPELAAAYAALIEDTGTLRGAKLFYPYLGSGLGRGPWVELADGSVKLDFITGIGPIGAGHGHPELLATSIDAALEDLVMQGNLQLNPVTRDVIALLVELASRQGAPLAHAYLSTTGAMANENALKMAFQKRMPANRVLAFRGGFAGRTIATAAITDKAAYREGVPLGLTVDYLPFPRSDRPAAEAEAHLLAALDEHLLRHPKQHACLLIELIQGEGGYWTGHVNAFTALCQRCRAAGISIIIDEVQSFARLEQPFSFQAYGLDQLVDIVTIGKISQVCATIYRDDHVPRPGLISQTFTAATSALHAGRWILRQLRDGQCYGSAGSNARLGATFRHGLEAIAARHPQKLQGPWGAGLMVGCTPLGGDKDRVGALAKQLFADGLLCFTAGSDPARIRFLPPVLGTDDSHIAEACRLLEAALLRG